MMKKRAERIVKKILATIFIFFITLQAHAQDLNKLIKDANFEKNTIVSISVRDSETQKKLFSKNDEMLMHPASALKAFTFVASLDTLGEDYTFDTTIFADSSGNLYIKLGADPLLNTGNLKSLAQLLKSNFNTRSIKNIYIDDTIIDKEPYPSGWTWDDFFPNYAMLSPYTLNQNKVAVTLNLATNKKSTFLVQPNPYKMSIINETKPGTIQNLVIKKSYDENTDIINIVGTVSGDNQISVPVANPKYYFIANLQKAFEKEGINYAKPYCFMKTPDKARVVAKVSHSMQEVSDSILKTSDNFSSEIVFKIAGAKYKCNNTPGSTQDGIDMFFNFYKNLGVNTDDIRLSDSSGVSRYNMLNTSWMSETLAMLEKNADAKDYLASPGEGTLEKRLSHLKGKLWAKTGTLNGLSSICGYVITQKNKNLTFAIIISNFNKKTSLIKALEDDLVDGISKF